MGSTRSFVSKGYFFQGTPVGLAHTHSTRAVVVGTAVCPKALAHAVWACCDDGCLKESFLAHDERGSHVEWRIGHVVQSRFLTTVVTDDGPERLGASNVDDWGLQT